MIIGFSVDRELFDSIYSQITTLHITFASNPNFGVEFETQEEVRR